MKRHTRQVRVTRHHLRRLSPGNPAAASPAPAVPRQGGPQPRMPSSQRTSLLTEADVVALIVGAFGSEDFFAAVTVALGRADTQDQIVAIVEAAQAAGHISALNPGNFQRQGGF